MSSIYKSQTIWSGNTYPIREQIKSLGGKWDAVAKAWIVPALSMRERATVGGMYQQMRAVRVVAK